MNTLIDKIMEDLVSVNPWHHSPFPYYPPYIREVLQKHLPKKRTYEQAFERWRQIGYKDWWIDGKKDMKERLMTMYEATDYDVSKEILSDK